MANSISTHKETATRIQSKFRELEKTNSRGLVIYLTAGDPTLAATGEMLPALERAGADVIELGIPFSDPLADGPVIQRASERALQAGATLRNVLATLPEWRKRTRVPIVLFSYFNPMLQYGLEQFAKDAKASGADGVLAVDLAPEEAGPLVEALRALQLDSIFLASPTSTAERLRKIAAHSSGFLYLVSRMGVTGERKSLPDDLAPFIERTRAETKLPLAVGFGISTPEQVRAVQEHAEAAVVGSAVVRCMEDHYAEEGVTAIEEFVRRLAGKKS